ncbi:putative vacuolar amino acid transporter YPQ3 [Gossypium australe]|uniref:Putative vacuolar amino acid transporter YPQ3 n=1 Tax=Gossypium australe TaxID=47621 RepID=A0A5B6UDM7_9ROSI|nr:putative vacuolar amino acid transporter YPQ3 [Gossypium australe]
MPSTYYLLKLKFDTAKGVPVKTIEHYNKHVIERGNVEGLNPFMFIFALVGNSTYVASILVRSMDWFRIRPNLPWLVDAGGCVLLDTFIVIQFIYFYKWASQDSEDKHETS